MSTAMRSAFNHIDEEYGGPPPPNDGPFGQGGAAPGVPGWSLPDARPRFKASRAYDKLISLVTVAVVCGVIGWFAVSGPEAVGLMLVAFVLVLVGWFRMRWARYLAPAYSVCQGLALGSVSKVYSAWGGGIVPAAIVFTAGVFIGALVLYRTGLVRVTPRMMSLGFMGALGLIAVGLLSLLGLPVPGLNELSGAGLVFSVLALGVAVLNLFTDFAYVTRSEAMGAPAEAEWAAAFAMMTAVVLVYISMLRILGAAAGGRRA